MTTPVTSSKAAGVIQTGNGRSASGRGQKGRLTQVFVCLPLEGAVHGIHLRLQRSGRESRAIRIAAVSEWKKASKELGGRCPVVAILPKSLYLVRTVELPPVAGEEVSPMLKLEVGAHLPPEFGAVEISYRPLDPRKEGNPGYESYVARRQELNDYLARLIAVGIYPDLILPSCVVWSLLLDQAQGTDLLVASLGAEQLEAASRSPVGAVNIRTIAAGHGDGRAEIIQRSLIEYVRSLLMQRSLEREAVAIGWFGSGCPSHLANGRILFRDIAEVLPGIRGTEEPADAVSLTLRCFAEGLLAAGEDWALQLSNLLPSEVVDRKQQRAVRRLTLLGGLLVLLACVLAGVALKIASHRYRARMADLSARIALIRREGESVGRRIEQLQAIQAARATCNDFTQVIAGLCDSAPAGLSYSNIDMDEDGRIRLQGQAESLAMAFLLPEQLEKQGGFLDVQPGDAARSRKGEGTIAEFRVNCRLSGRTGADEGSGLSRRTEPGVNGMKGIPSRKEGR
ncbi:MAG: hypothetical protein ACM359_03080 [Bacillota bacterium]